MSNSCLRESISSSRYLSMLISNDIFQSHYMYNMLKWTCTFGVKYVPADLGRWHIGTAWADIMVGDRPVKEGHRQTHEEGIS